MNDLLSGWESHLRFVLRRSDNTITGYLRALAELSEAHPDLDAATAGDLVRFVGACTERGLAPSSVNQRIAAVKSFYEWRGTDQADKLRTQKVPARQPRALTNDELLAVLSAVSGTSVRAFKTRTLMLFLLYTGCRLSEALDCEVGDIDWDRAMLRVVGKGDKERFVPVQNIIRELQVWVERHRPKLECADGWLFPSETGGQWAPSSVQRAFQTVGRNAGVERVHPHVFRSSYATALRRGGASLESIQRLLGHSSLTTTGAYLAVDEADLKQAVDVLPDLGDRRTYF